MLKTTALPALIRGANDLDFMKVGEDYRPMTLGFFLKWQVSTPTIHTLPSWEYTDGSTRDEAIVVFARRNRLKVLSVSISEIWLEAKDGAEVCYTVIEREE